MIGNDRCLYNGDEASNRGAFQHYLRVCSNIFDLVSIRLLQRFFRGGRGRQGSRSSLANSFISNQSIKSDPVQIVVKDCLRSHQTEVCSVWSNVVSITGQQRQVDSLSANSKQTALTLSFSPWSVLLMTVESIPKGTSSIRQSGLEIVWQLLCAVNCKRHGDHPLTFLMRIRMIDSSVS